MGRTTFYMLEQERKRKREAKEQEKKSMYDDMNYDELYSLAQQANIKGRSEMSKKELVEALKEVDS